MYQSCIVADSIRHAEIMIGWLNLDPSVWLPIRYGDKVRQYYENAKIIRPLSGATEDHLDWLMDELLPNVGRRRNTIPAAWEPDGEEREGNPLDYSSMWL